MSYDKPNREKYDFPNTDFGSGSAVEFNIIGPKGKRGRLFDYGVQNATEVFNGDATVPSISVGTTSDPDAYGDEFSLNALADNDGKSVRSTHIENSAGWNALMVERDIPADTEIVLTCNTGVTSPTGQAAPFVIVDWQD